MCSTEHPLLSPWIGEITEKIVCLGCALHCGVIQGYVTLENENGRAIQKLLLQLPWNDNTVCVTPMNMAAVLLLIRPVPWGIDARPLKCRKSGCRERGADFIHCHLCPAVFHPNCLSLTEKLTFAFTSGCGEVLSLVLCRLLCEERRANTWSASGQQALLRKDLE
jgi:hypothetical protein